MATRLFYFDDSGHNNSGWAVYGWIEVAVSDWNAGLKSWLDFRKTLYTTTGIPVTYELHTTDFLGVKSRPSREAAWNSVYENRFQVITDALKVIANTPCLSVGAVYRHTEERGRAYHRQTVDLYQRLVFKLDAELTAAGDIGIIVMDGDGTAGSYVSAHRALDLSTRSIVEDPMFQHSQGNQWVQIADLVAYVAYQGLLRAEVKKFAWDWYADHLSGSDRAGGTQAL